MFYLKLAKNNLKVNRSIYFPFLLSMIFLVVMNTIMQILLNNKGMTTLPGAESAIQLFSFGSIVIFIFSFIFSIYTNSFLLKQRKKELGLYNVLGLGKKELRIVLAFESLIAFLITIIIGFILGTIFSKLCFLILKKMTNLGEGFTFSVNLTSYLIISLFFFFTFLLLFLWNSWQIRRMNPIELLKGTQKGEKEPKANWIVGVLGLIMLVSAYYMSVTITSPLEAFTKFFIAVVLVIIATYALFSATSIVILKLLKKNKTFFYKPNHFIAVSSMMYRMKQNAAGLASISILSTMVIVTLSTTSSLYVGMDNVLNNRNPYDISLSVSEKPEEWLIYMTDTTSKHHLEVDSANYFTMNGGGLFKETSAGFELVPPKEMGPATLNQANLIYSMSVSEFNRVSGNQLDLSQGDIWLYDMAGNFKEDTLNVLGRKFNIVNQPKHLDFLPKVAGLTNTMLIITSDTSFMKQMIEQESALVDRSDKTTYTTVYLNYTGSEKDGLAFANEVKDSFTKENSRHLLSAKAIDAEDISNFIGGFLFLGVIFGLTFTLSTALIIYYKQVSEGLQDKERFQIMQRVGMSQTEVRKSIRGQILMVFFFPIVLASLNLGFALPMISKLLILFGLADNKLLIITSTITVTIFFIIYLLMYLQTSKVYYKLVERK